MFFLEPCITRRGKGILTACNSAATRGPGPAGTGAALTGKIPPAQGGDVISTDTRAEGAPPKGETMPDTADPGIPAASPQPAPAGPVPATRPGHPVHALATFELSRYRRDLEHAITGVSPDAPARDELRRQLDDVLPRKNHGPSSGTPAGKEPRPVTAAPPDDLVSILFRAFFTSSRPREHRSSSAIPSAISPAGSAPRQHQPPALLTPARPARQAPAHDQPPRTRRRRPPPQLPAPAPALVRLLGQRTTPPRPP